MFKLATWNVNSLTVRLEQVLAWLASSEVDVLALQETKVIDEKFPIERFTELGFHVAFSGQKTYNGVAIISRYPIQDVITDIPTLSDPQRRILVATIGDIRVINLYIPNGSEVGSDKYNYKLDWLNKVTTFIQQQLQENPNVVVLGDFNIAPEDIDVHDPIAWQGCVHVSPLERKAFFDLIALGLIDSFREFTHPLQQFSWWDYRAASFRRNNGLRIDHILLSSALRNTCVTCEIDVEPRRNERPSDHAPVWLQLNR